MGRVRNGERKGREGKGDGEEVRRGKKGDAKEKKLQRKDRQQQPTKINGEEEGEAVRKHA